MNKTDTRENYKFQTRNQGKFGIKGQEPLGKKVVGFRLPESIDKKLELIAQEQNLSKNELAKQILIQALEA